MEELIKYGANGKYKKLSRDKVFIKALKNVYAILKVVERADMLEVYGALHYEKLKYERSGLSSVRIKYNRVERLIFREINDGVEIIVIELDDTHYGNKK